ncbi:phosphotransferase family protein [Kribbella sindirgiensis]|nr:aminoglycoside phosphotransferase family protein [Kribbella sindirgiensis]
MPSTEFLLHELVAEAGLPEVTSYQELSGHGFDHVILLATLADGARVVLRHRAGSPRPLAVEQARFLADHDVPAPRLLGGNDEATLYEYAPGEMLSTLVAEGRMTGDAWRSLGTALQRLHAVRFPNRLRGAFGPDGLTLTSADPVAMLHERVSAAEDYLRTHLPEVAAQLPRAHALIDAHADSLSGPTALLHRDMYPANIIIGPVETLLIDWDDAHVGDPASEIAALEEHIYLIDRTPQLPDPFYETYGPRVDTVDVWRLCGAIGWYAGGDFEEFEQQPDQELRAKARRWQAGLADYLRLRLG